MLAAVAILCQCKEKPQEPYANERIAIDNAKAAMYFHVVFQEAENAWAFIDGEDYNAGDYPAPGNTQTSYKDLKCSVEDNAVTVTIVYNGWKTTNDNLLFGNIRVVFLEHSYRRPEELLANVHLDDFSINGQDVTGQATIRYRHVEDSENDHYAFTLSAGAAIHEVGHRTPQIMTCAVNNGQYERVEGNETFSMDDDVWAFHGTMTGRLRNDPSLNYTNIVTATVTTTDGNSIDGRLHFNMLCEIAQRGFSQIKIPERPDIFVAYHCKLSELDSVTHIQ